MVTKVGGRGPSPWINTLPVVNKHRCCGSPFVRFSVFTWHQGKKIMWLARQGLRSYHIAKFDGHKWCESSYITFLNFHAFTWVKKSHDIVDMVDSPYVTTRPNFIDMRISICQVTTWLKGHLIWCVGSPPSLSHHQANFSGSRCYSKSNVMLQF